MDELKNFYEVLGVSENASADEIKKSYRALAKKWHPDRYSDPEEKKVAEEKFKEITEANSILSDSKKRQEYDNVRNNPFGGGYNPFEHGPWSPDDFFSGFDEPEKVGDDVYVDVYVTINEVINGCKDKEIEYPYYEFCDKCNGYGTKDGKEHKCKTCNGTGRISKRTGDSRHVFIQQTTCPDCGGSGYEVTDKCDECGGKGYKVTKQKMKIDIPKGVFTGAKMSMPNMGKPIKGGRNGNLYFVFYEMNDDKFRRINNDYVTDVEVNLSEALIGCEKIVECPDGGKVKIKIPELTQYGKQYLLRGRGAMDIRTGIFGNLVVRIVYKLPSKMTEEHKKIITEFCKLDDNDNK